MGEFVVEVPVGVRPGERFVASVGNGRKVTVRSSVFATYLLSGWVGELCYCRGRLYSRFLRYNISSYLCVCVCLKSFLFEIVF